MVPAAYHGFFSACASVAGTLIGLLFVAISVSPHKDVGSRAPLAFQIQAGVAFTTLINSLIIALVALMPGENLGLAAVVLSGAGLSSTIGLTLLSIRSWPGPRHLWGLVIVPVLAALYLLQLRSGIELLNHPRDSSAVRFETVLVIVFFIVAIARAWRMIGARDTRMLAVIGTLLRERGAEVGVAEAGDERSDDGDSVSAP
jgi:hypothetical protein